MARDLLLRRVRCDQHAPGLVRAALADLPELGWMLGDAMLVASELVTNAVRHSGCSEEEELVVSVVANDGLRIIVTDPGTSGRRAEIAKRDVGFGGLGLRVVDQLVNTWGDERRPDGHVVWAELPGVPADPRARPPAASRSERARPSVTYADDPSAESMPAN